MFIEVFLLITACIAIWFATSIAIEAIEQLSNHSYISKFTLSLFVIGVVTSFPEIAITLSSVMLNSPQVALGNLIGSQIFLLFVVVPFLAIIGKGLHLQIQMKNVSLLLTILVVGASIVPLFNQRLDFSEVLIILGLYVAFLVTFFHKTSHQLHLERTAERMTRHPEVQVMWNVLKLGGAVGVLMLASHSAVRELIEISSILQTPRFLLSMLILPIGTNLPEVSLALASLATGKREFALADYLGALTFNSLLIGLLALGFGGSIALGQNISGVIIVFVGGLGIFWWSCYSREVLSVKESVGLLLIYLALLVVATGQVMSGILS